MGWENDLPYTAYGFIDENVAVEILTKGHVLYCTEDKKVKSYYKGIHIRKLKFPEINTRQFEAVISSNESCIGLCYE